MKVGLVILLSSVMGVALAQAPPSPITVKSTPASDALVAAAKDLQSAQKTLEVATQQANETLKGNQKVIQDQLTAISTDLNKRLRADKKYSADFAKIDALSKQLQSATTEAQGKFTTQYGAIQQKVGTDQSVINSLVPVVRTENGLGEKATFDPATQQWKESK